MDRDDPPWLTRDLDDFDPKTGPVVTQEDCDWQMGKLVLAGLTYPEPDGETVRAQVQYRGRVVDVRQGHGVSIACEGAHSGQTCVVPADLRNFERADRHEYRLRSTGEVVVDPDLLTTWTITAPTHQ